MSSEGAFETFAEDLGHLLGSAQTKAAGWLGQRQQIAEQLTKIRDSATELLGKLGSRAASVASAVKRGRRSHRAGSGEHRSQERPKGRTVSAAARKKMSDAATKRWAARRVDVAEAPVVAQTIDTKTGGRAGKGQRRMSAEARKAIS